MSALLIDIGNTRLKWCMAAAFEPGAGSVGTPDVDATAVALSAIDRLAAHWRVMDTHVESALIGNVASINVGVVVERILRARWPGIRIGHAASSARRGGVVNGYADPRQLGVDRWMAMIGAHAFVPDRPLLVCSFGTATTIDLLVRETGDPDARARFVGGMILPGVDAMRRALIDGTARLPDRRGAFVPFARNTDDAIATGIIAAQLGATERAWRDARDRTGDPSLGCLIAGGSTPTLAPLLDDLGIANRIVPDLVLRGLAVVAREGTVDWRPT